LKTPYLLDSFCRDGDRSRKRPAIPEPRRFHGRKTPHHRLSESLEAENSDFLKPLGNVLQKFYASDLKNTQKKRLTRRMSRFRR